MSVESVDLQGKKVLFVAYFYPPSESTGVPGSMRTLKFIRNLTNGERYVLTTPPQVAGARDALSHISLPVNSESVNRVGSWDLFRFLLAVRRSLLKILGKKQRSVAQSGPEIGDSVFKNATDDPTELPGRMQRFKDFVYNLCYFPDQAGPWIIPAFLAGRRLVKQRKLDVVFATGSPWSGLIVGYLISRATGKPLIADFRDPWMNNPFHQSKGKLLDRWSARLEQAVVRHAAAVSLNTPPLLDEFLKRYPTLDKTKFFVLPNGFDPAEFDHVIPEARPDQGRSLLLCHAGFLYGVRDPEVLLEAIRKANRRLAASAKRVVFRQIGDVQLSYDIQDRYADLIEDHSLLIDAPRPYKECLSVLASADAVVNIQPATQSQIPSKLYDYLGINRPIINITSRDGALGRLVTERDIGSLVEFDEVDTLTDILVREAETKSTPSFSGYASREDFNIHRISAILAQKIVQLSP